MELWEPHLPQITGRAVHGHGRGKGQGLDVERLSRAQGSVGLTCNDPERYRPERLSALSGRLILQSRFLSNAQQCSAIAGSLAPAIRVGACMLHAHSCCRALTNVSECSQRSARNGGSATVIHRCSQPRLPSFEPREVEPTLSSLHAVDLPFDQCS